MNNILFESSYIGSTNGFLSIVICVILCTFAWMHQIKQKDTVKTKWVYETNRVASIFWGIALLWMLGNFISGYSKSIFLYKSGNYCEVEGIVENYEEDEKGGESFTINGVKFEVRRHTITWGYTLIFTKDSVIAGNGQHLRIRYLPRNHTIVYIEELTEEVN